MNTFRMLNHTFREKTCKICGKKMVVVDDNWAYIRKRTTTQKAPYYFCSWKHLREFDAANQRKLGRQRTDKAEEIIRLIKEGKGTMEIVRELGVSKTTVAYYKTRTEQEMDIDE